MKTEFRFYILLMLGLLCVAGCGDDDDDTEITNSQPVIDRVIVPEEVKVGEKVKLEVFAHDVDGDPLSYTWEVTAGTVDSAGLWSVPSAATSATVWVHVRDGINTPVASSRISVEIVLSLKPIAPPEGMVLIPAGEFQMGSNAPEAYDDEQPVHTVYVDAFFMDKYEVTNLDYKEFVRANPHWGKDQIDRRFDDRTGRYLKHWNGNDYPGGEANRPVMWVSWYAAVAYAKWVEKRLPTEAEWEYAARGGLSGKVYPWGDVIDSGKANYARNTGGTAAVGEYPPNGYGLYDMTGNVSEWCLDEYNEDFYSSSPRKNPLSGANSVDWVMNNFTDVKKLRVLRGGSWIDNPKRLRVAYRVKNAPALTGGYSGFRCARAQ